MDGVILVVTGVQDSPLGGSLREMLSLIFEIESKVPPFLQISFLPFSGVFSFVFLGKYLCTFYTKKKISRPFFRFFCNAGNYVCLYDSYGGDRTVCVEKPLFYHRSRTFGCTDQHSLILIRV